MEKLWAPWRTVYVGKPAQEGECIFCTKLKESDDAGNYVLLRTKMSVVLLNLYPYNSGHLMVAPQRHVGELEELTPAEINDLGKTVQLVLGCLREVFRPEGFNLGANLGRVAGAGIPGHLHLHIVPRWQGDTNFMPVIAETKVVSEGLAYTYAKLSEALAKRKEKGVTPS